MSGERSFRLLLELVLSPLVIDKELVFVGEDSGAIRPLDRLEVPDKTGFNQRHSALLAAVSPYPRRRYAFRVRKRAFTDSQPFD